MEDKKETEDFYNLLKPGDAIISSSDGIFSKLIQFFTRSRYTHVECFLYAKYGEGFLIGAGSVYGILSKVRVTLLSQFSNFVVMRPKNLEDNEREILVKSILEQYNQPYGYSQIPIIAYRLMLKWLNKIGFSFHVPEKDIKVGEWTCSELYAYGCDQVNKYQGKDEHFFNMIPINVVPGRIAADTIRMEKILEYKDGKVRFD